MRHFAPVRALVAGGLAAALLATACDGGRTSIQSSEDVVDAIADTFSGSFTATFAFDLDIDRETLQSIADIDPGFDAVDQAQLDQMAEGLDEYLDAARDNRGTFTKAEDGSILLGATIEDDPVYELRLSLRELLSGESLTPEVGAIALVDIDRLLDSFNAQFETGGETSVDIPSVDELRTQAEGYLPPGPLGDVGRALLDGEYGGVLGTLDLEAFGATQEDFDEFFEDRDDITTVLEEARLRDLFAAAVGIHEVSTDAGRTVVSLDVRPRDAVRAGMDVLRDVESTVLELDPDTEPLPEDLESSFEDETGIAVDDLPEVVEEVAELWFDGDGHLTHVEVDLIGLGERIIAVLPEPSPDSVRFLEELADATAVMRWDLADFGTVDTVMDVEATTIEWDDLTDLFGMFPGGVSG